MTKTTWTAPTSDDELIERLLRNDETAFRELISANHSYLLIVARAILGESFAEEAVQEAWVSIIKALPSFKRQSSLKTWMIRIVSNEAKSRLRRELRYAPLDSPDRETPADWLGERFQANGAWQQPPPQWEIGTPEALLEEEQLRHCIEQTMKELPHKQKAVFMLRDVELQSLEEVCNNLQVSASNARVLLHRARLKLMEVIDRYQETGKC